MQPHRGRASGLGHESLPGTGTQPRREVNDTVHITKLSSVIARLFRTHDRGQGLAEYALILGLIAIVAIVALLFLGNGISGALSTVGDAM
jgi:Flp pilus assembly pilin Flp